MNKIKLVYVVILFSTFGFSQANGIENDLFENETLLYNVHVKMKYFFKTDTTNRQYTVVLEKNKQDSLYGYNFKIFNRHTLYINWGNTLYSISKKDKVYTTSKKVDLNIKNLLLPNRYIKAKDLSDSLRIIEKNRREVVIRRDKKDFKEFNNIYFNYYIDLKNRLSYKITSHVNFQGNSQYKEFLFENIRQKSDVNFKSEIENLKKYRYDSFEKKQKPVSKNSIKVKDFEGYLLSQDETLSLSSYYGKIIILDFWYMSCYPCIKAIPFINKLRNDFTKEDVVVLGVNLIDENKKQIRKFTEDFNIQYEVLLAKNNAYNIKAYPAIVIIDKNKEILYSGSGVRKEEESKIIDIINMALRN
ncbi:TlpA family protein disulfide reductase [Haloflavibacter putidus]|uniref:TlpA family protein disulfide reductase n=1 Tax=Haloflavibacter putidus TaxID=2576776 RepID=A0A507ZK38_9FLAO|nr:TlpA disulfide reductase family protein [Haloflavibacter putidus]TQD36933.1 TlpA family protein disulfide reductase [Haloflavibacter putidus]